MGRKTINYDCWEERICPICNRTFNVRKKVNKINCSDECRKKYIEIHKDEINKKRSFSLKENIKKRGVDGRQKEIENRRKNALKKYGVDAYQKTNEYREKMSIIQKSKDWSERSERQKQELIKKYENLCNENNLKLIEFRNRFDCDIQCTKCNNVFTTHVIGYLTDDIKTLCRNCYPITNFKTNSIPNQFIENFLIENNINFIKNNRSILYPYEIDFLVPDFKLGIEINGNYFHSEIGGGKNKDYHINKTIKGHSKNIKLIHIFEDEIINKPEIVKSRLRNELSIIPNKFYARKCIIKKVSNKEKKCFLDNNHIDGDSISKENIGLYYNDELVSIATFSARKISKTKQYELIRFCSKINTCVVGGFSKLLKYALKNIINENNLITYADIRWSGINNLDNVYIKNGFSFINNTTPNYYYVDRKCYLKRFHRLNFSKNNLKKLGYNLTNKTEWEIMQENNYDRIWGCGSMKFELKK